MNRVVYYLLPAILFLSPPSYAAEMISDETETAEFTEVPFTPSPAAPPARPASPPPAAPMRMVESDKAKAWKGIEAQEQWVARLKKQIDGETRQLSEMRAVLAEKYKLNERDLEDGVYMYDEEKDEFVEKLS